MAHLVLTRRSERLRVARKSERSVRAGRIGSDSIQYEYCIVDLALESAREEVSQCRTDRDLVDDPKLFYAWVNCVAYLLEGAWILIRPLMGYRVPHEVRARVD